jgi:hypothetical protein
MHILWLDKASIRKRIPEEDRVPHQIWTDGLLASPFEFVVFMDVVLRNKRDFMVRVNVTHRDYLRTSRIYVLEPAEMVGVGRRNNWVTLDDQKIPRSVITGEVYCADEGTYSFRHPDSLNLARNNRMSEQHIAEAVEVFFVAKRWFEDIFGK